LQPAEVLVAAGSPWPQVCNLRNGQATSLPPRQATRGRLHARPPPGDSAPGFCASALTEFPVRPESVPLRSRGLSDRLPYSGFLRPLARRFRRPPV